MIQSDSKNMETPNILFSDYFLVDKKCLDEHGAFNISFVADLPLFIDPFLLFNSKKPKYQILHKGIIKYLKFLRDKSAKSEISKGLLLSWYRFKEIKQTWFGFSERGNKGSALGLGFARALNDNFHQIFNDYGNEEITKEAHLEKLCLIEEGVGKDNISDFTTNLIKDYLLEYTQDFAGKYLEKSQCKKFRVQKAFFNYKTESWTEKEFNLPRFKNDYVLLVPKDILTKDDNWINRSDLVEDFENIPYSISNIELRGLINNYFLNQLPQKHTKKDKKKAALSTILKYPEIIDYFIKSKEEHGNAAIAISKERIDYSENIYVENFKKLSVLLGSKSKFYLTKRDSYSECMERARFLKSVIENNGGHRYFHDKNGQPIRREEDLKILFRLTWFASIYDFSTEVNNGRGPADATVSLGSADKTIVELKLARNTQLKRNLEKQVEIYKKSSGAQKDIKIIIYFSVKEHEKVKKILEELNLEDKENIILIDAIKDNKPSASKA